MKNTEDIVLTNMEYFYKNLKEKIEEHGFTQTSFAREHSVNADWFNRVIRTRSKSLSIYYIMKLASSSV